MIYTFLFNSNNLKDASTGQHSRQISGPFPPASKMPLVSGHCLLLVKEE